MYASLIFSLIVSPVKPKVEDWMLYSVTVLFLLDKLVVSSAMHYHMLRVFVL